MGKSSLKDVIGEVVSAINEDESSDINDDSLNDKNVKVFFKKLVVPKTKDSKVTPSNKDNNSNNNDDDVSKASTTYTTKDEDEKSNDSNWETLEKIDAQTKEQLENQEIENSTWSNEIKTLQNLGFIEYKKYVKFLEEEDGNLDRVIARIVSLNA